MFVAFPNVACLLPLQEPPPRHLHLHPAGDPGLHPDQHRLLLLHDPGGAADLQRCGGGEQLPNLSL